MVRNPFGGVFNFSFDDDVRRALADARNEASDCATATLAPNTSFLHAIRLPDVVDTLRHLGVLPEQLRTEIEERLPAGTESVALMKLAYTAPAKRVLEER